MKVVMKPIEMIAWFTEDGIPKPLRYRITDENGEKTVIKVNKVITTSEEKLAGNRMIIYTCQSCINNIEKVYELKYELSTCKWYLSKI